MGAAGILGSYVALRGQEKIRIVADFSGSDPLTRYVRDQPQLADAPAVNGWLATDPEEFQELFLWDNLDEQMHGSLSRMRDNLEPGTHFVSVVAAALRFDYGLTKYKDPRLDGDTFTIYAKPTKVSVGGGDDPDPGERLYTYYYSIARWELQGDTDPPSDVTVHFKKPADANYEPTPLPTETPSTE